MILWFEQIKVKTQILIILYDCVERQAPSSQRQFAVLCEKVVLLKGFMACC